MNERQRAVLAAAGLADRADGYVLEDVAAVAQRRGWTCTTTPSTTSHGRPGRWRASIFVPPSPKVAPGPLYSRGSRGLGDTDAAALALALARALEREDR